MNWEMIWSELWRFSVYGSIGFVVGAGWCAIWTRNKQIDEALKREFKDIDKITKL